MSYISRIGSKKREKVFTDGKQTPIDREDRGRVMAMAYAARRDKLITRAAVDVFYALLYKFANLSDGRCFPSYDKIAEEAGCAKRTVSRCIKALEAAGLLTWVHRVRRVRERVEGLGGIWAISWRVVRTSNAYDFPLVAKKAQQFISKGQKSLGTYLQATLSFLNSSETAQSDLEKALLSLGNTIKACS